MTVAGIDFSSRAVHIVLLDADTTDASLRVFAMLGSTPFERARSLRRVFPTRGFWEDNGVYLVGIEDPHSRANHTAKALGLAAGAIAALLPNAMTVVQTAPSEWHRLFTGNASASKDEVAAHARQVWPEPPPDGDDNAWDAYGIAWAVRTLNQHAVQQSLAIPS